MSIQDFEKDLLINGYEPVRPLKIDGNVWGRLRYNGEKAGAASGGYKLIENPDGSLFANYGSTKDPQGFRSWRSEQVEQLSWQELAAKKQARDDHRKFLEQLERQKHERLARRLERVVGRMPIALDHPYLTDKQIDGMGIRLRQKGNELIIPRYGAGGMLYSVQRIRQKTLGEKSWKGYFAGGRVKGTFYLIGEPGNSLVIAEGFATAASVWLSTGIPTVVAFDCGNLQAVAKVMKERFPGARVIFAADDDQWTFAAGKKPKDLGDSTPAGNDQKWREWRDAGILFNPGVDKAQAAAAAIGGAFVIRPEFPGDHPSKPTDFNDLMIEKGRSHVKMLFDRPLEIPQVSILVEEAPPSGIDDPRISDMQPAGGSAKTGPGDMGMNFRILGYNNGTYYYYPFAMRQIIGLSAAGHTMSNLLQLDSLEHWEASWRDNDGKLKARHQSIALYAAASMTQIAEKRGVFVEESVVRGAGAWIDDGRVVLHCGDMLYIDGHLTPFGDFKSDYTYVAASKLMRPSADPLSNAEARRLRVICEALTWENKLSGTLLAGWLVIAPICAALQYRPHIYITGEAESGKSTVMDLIIKQTLGKLALCLDGGTSEPAVREAMGYNGRPLVYDEAEGSSSMPDVLMLARKATTGSVVKKFGQRPFKARFCACFSAINPPVNKTADESRISFMHLKKNRRSSAIQEFEDLKALIDEVISSDFPERLIARTLQNMNNLLANIRIFQKAVRQVTGGARASQQIGSMMAGVWMLGSTAVATDEQALEIVRRFNYADHTILEDIGDPMRLVQWITGSLVPVKNGLAESIGELILKVDIENDAAADRVLRNYGIAVKSGGVSIASRSQNLARILRETEWADKWSRTLSDIEGAEKFKIEYFSTGIKTSGVRLPIALFTDRQSEEPAPQLEAIEF